MVLAANEIEINILLGLNMFIIYTLFLYAHFFSYELFVLNKAIHILFDVLLYRFIKDTNAKLRQRCHFK